jgi:hypothetical protein
MRTDLGWSYLLAGSMNTVNALGYPRQSQRRCCAAMQPAALPAGHEPFAAEIVTVAHAGAASF